jgi:Effector-associated domain 2
MVESLDGDGPDAIRGADRRSGAHRGDPAGWPRSAMRRAPLFRLLEAALAVPALADDRSRNMIVALLPPDVARSVQRYQAARYDVWAILRTCSNYPDGLADLLDVVRAFEGDSGSMRRLSADIAELPPDSGTGAA